MISAEQYVEVAQEAVRDTVEDFHFDVKVNGWPTKVPFTYQIEELGFRPYRAGKASPEEIQAELDSIIGRAYERGIDLGLESADSVTKLALQNGLGVDCSNFAYHVLETMHTRMDLTPYTQTVFRDAAEIRKLHETRKPSWDAKDAEKNVRELTEEEKTKLQTADLLDIEWITQVFGKDTAFVLGSAHICGNQATEEVEPEDVLPGDLLAFRNTATGLLSHVAVVDQAQTDGGGFKADFWHSWHARDFTSGVRKDSVAMRPGGTFEADGTLEWSHEGFDDPERYAEYVFRRPIAMAAAYRAIVEAA